MDTNTETPSDIASGARMGLVSQIVSSYVSANKIDSQEVPGLIHSVDSALKECVHGPAQPEEEAPPTPPPGVNPKRTVFPDYLICLEDGRKLKTLKRHLSQLGITPEDYKKKWNLPSNYPMTAPNYAAQRSNIAKTIGLGKLNADKK